MVNTPTSSHATPPNTIPPSNTIIDLPLKGNKKAPKTFSGDYRKVKDFFANIETACHKEGVTSAKEKCKAVVRYSSREVTSVIKGLVSYKDNDYEALKKEVIFMYDGDRTEVEYDISDIRHLVKRWNKSCISDLPTYKNYYKEFQKIVGWLHVRNKVTNEEFKLWFWAGLPEKFRRKVEARLRIEDPTLDIRNPFEINKITGVVQKLYARDRFENRIPLLLKGRQGKRERNKDEESDSEGESDSESSSAGSEEEFPAIPERMKMSPTPKKQVHFREEKKREMPKIQERSKEEPSVETLIDQMKTLNLNNPRHRAFWAEASRENPDIRERIKELNAFTFGAELRLPREVPPHMRNKLEFIQRTNTGGYSDDRQCYGCGLKGHVMGRCERVQKMVSDGVVIRNMSGRWTWANGAPIAKQDGESMVEAVNRKLKTAALITVTPDDGMSVMEEESGESESDEMVEGRETYVGWHLTNRDGEGTAEDFSDGEESAPGWRKIVDEEEKRLVMSERSREALAAERSEKGNKAARYRPNEKGYVQKSSNGKGAFRGRGNGPENVNAIPIDEKIRREFGNGRSTKRGEDLPKREAEKKRENADDTPMVVDEGTHKDKRKGTMDKSRGPEEDASKEGSPGKMETNAVALEIIEKLMGREITIPLARLLKIAPEVQRALGRMARGQSVRSRVELERKEGEVVKPSGELINEKQVYLQADLKALDLGKARDKLPTVEARVGRARMRAIIDTGAMVNVISERMFKKAGLPRNDDTLQLKDVNGGSKGSSGMIEMAKIYITPNRRITVGDLWVMNTEKFDLLLGREWQTMNRTGIQEKEEGTFLNFRSRGKEYDVNVLPAPEVEGEGDDEWEEGSQEEEWMPRKERQRTACVVQVEESGRKGKGRELDERRGGQGVDGRGTPEGCERTGRSWTLEGDQNDSENLQDEVRETVPAFLETQGDSYLEEGEIDELEPGGNKYEVVVETPDLWSNGSGIEGEGGNVVGAEESTISNVEGFTGRKRVRRETSEESESREEPEIDEESDYWRKIVLKERTKRRKRETTRKDTQVDLEVERRRQERTIQSILRGRTRGEGTRGKTRGHMEDETQGSVRDGKEREEKNKRETYSNRPWADWSSDDLEDEWGSLKESESDDDERSRNEGEEGRRPPNNQEAFKAEPTRKRVGRSKIKNEMVTVRRSTRTRRLTEKELGEERQRYVRRAEKRRQAAQERERQGQKIVSLVIVNRNRRTDNELEEGTESTQTPGHEADRGEREDVANDEGSHEENEEDASRRPAGKREGTSKKKSNDRERKLKVDRKRKISLPRSADPESKISDEVRQLTMSSSTAAVEAPLKTCPPMDEGIPVSVLPSNSPLHIFLPFPIPTDPFFLPVAGFHPYKTLSPLDSKALASLGTVPLLLHTPHASHSCRPDLQKRLRTMTQVPCVPIASSTNSQLPIPPHDRFISRTLEGLQDSIRRPYIDYAERPGILRMSIASMHLDQVAADPTTWQPALIGVSHLQEVSTHFSFESDPIRDFLGLGVSLRVRAVNGQEHSLLGDVFIRFVPRTFLGVTDPGQFAFPDYERFTNSFARTFVIDNGPRAREDDPMTEPDSVAPLELEAVSPFPVFPPLETSRDPRVRDVPMSQFDILNEDTLLPKPTILPAPSSIDSSPADVLMTLRQLVPPPAILPPTVVPSPSPKVAPVPSSNDISAPVLDDLMDLSSDGSVHGGPETYLDEESGKVCLRDVAKMSPRLARSTPSGSSSPYALPFRYFDPCSELDMFLASLPTFTYPVTSQDLELLEEGHLNHGPTIEVPDEAFQADDERSTDNERIPRKSVPRYAVSYTRSPLGVLRLETDLVTNEVKIQTRAPIDNDNDNAIMKFSMHTPPPSPKRDPFPIEENDSPSLHASNSRLHDAPQGSVDEPMSELVPDLTAQESQDFPIVYNTRSPIYVPGSPPKPLDPTAECYVPSSPPRPLESAQERYVPISPSPPILIHPLDAVEPHTLKSVNDRLCSIERHATISSSHHCDTRGLIKLLQGSINEVRESQLLVRADLASHVALNLESTNNARLETNRLSDESEISRKQIEELTWMYNRMGVAADTTDRLARRVDVIEGDISTIKTRRTQTDKATSVYKRNTRQWIQAIQSELDKFKAFNTPVDKRLALLVRDVVDLKSARELDRGEWVNESSEIRKAVYVEFNERISTIERVLTGYAQSQMNRSMYPPTPAPNMPLYTPPSSISAATVEHVLSALMTAPSRQVRCAA